MKSGNPAIEPSPQDDGYKPHCPLSLISRSLTIFPHFSYSDLRNVPNESGVPPTGVAPTLTSLSRTAGSASASLTALFSFATTAGGVFAGASNPYQLDASVFG